jgi:L-fuconolactonase
MTGDAKGEYGGTGYRNDAELKAWLAQRPGEAALEPDLPIIDPHHHFWDTPQRGRYLLSELLADIGGGHNIVSTVFLECRSMYRKDGPAEMAPVGEVEFVNGITTGARLNPGSRVELRVESRPSPASCSMTPSRRKPSEWCLI